ncbi:MAG: tol-pal system protein YbgF [Aquisalimonadaceae bacterium]
MTRSVIRTRNRLWLPLATLLLAIAPSVHAQSTSDRLDRLERLLESSVLLEISDQNEQLRREVQRLTGELDVAKRELEELQRQQRSLYEDVDTRLQSLEQRGDSGSTDTASTPSQTGDALTVPETPLLDADVAGEQNETEVVDPAENGDAEADYRAAFELLREGRYGAAGDAFRGVLEDHPGTQQADNARYWLGESYYVARDFESAMEHFQAVMEDPDNNKQPDAMLKAGYIQYERGNYGEARETLEQVREGFPNSTVATLAENRLRRMREEGR